MGCMLMSASNPAIACVWALPTYIAACIGLRQALRRIGSEQFPEILNLVPGPNRSTVERARISPATVGWPFGSLGPIRSRSRLPIADAVAIAVLGGWFLACFMTFYGNRSDSARD